MKRAGLACVGVLLLLSPLSCKQLPLGNLLGGLIPPELRLDRVSLVKSPNSKTIAMALCPQVAGSLICRLIGPAPSPEEIAFAFDVGLEARNPNPVPLPEASALLAFTAFPGVDGGSKMGTTCVSLCNKGDFCGPPPENGCNQNGALTSGQDYANAATGFMTQVVTGGGVPKPNVRTIPANGAMDAVVRLQLEPLQMLGLFSKVATTAIGQIEKGRIPTFEVPYSLAGTAFVDVENVGVMGSDFGPRKDSWRL